MVVLHRKDTSSADLTLRACNPLSGGNCLRQQHVGDELVYLPVVTGKITQTKKVKLLPENYFRLDHISVTEPGRTV